MDARLTESREKEIFRELIGAAKPAPGSVTIYAAVAERHRISPETVIAIERKGMARDWPPLD